MREAGIREARQNISALLDEVREGREIVITDRGRPVARLVPYQPQAARPFESRGGFRGSMPSLDPPLSATLDEQRDEQL
jgi:prevent-host-death family protein